MSTFLPYYYVDTQEGDRYCLMDGNDMSKKGAYRMLDEIKRAPELLQENERLKIENGIYFQERNDAWKENESQRKRIEELTKWKDNLQSENWRLFMKIEELESAIKSNYYLQQQIALTKEQSGIMDKQSEQIKKLEGLLKETYRVFVHPTHDFEDKLANEIKAALNL